MPDAAPTAPTAPASPKKQSTLLDKAPAVRIADHLSFLRQGQIVATGTSDELLHSERLAAAEFVRASRISLE